MSEDARLALARELERGDKEVGDALAKLDELYEAVAGVREEALELEAFLERLPAERAAIRARLEETAGELAEAQTTAAHAEAELQEAEREGGPERVAAARRFAVRARDGVFTASRLASEARAEEALLEGRATAAEREAPALERRARELARSLRGRARLVADAGTEPSPGLEGVSEWAAGARAALLVARTALSAERDAVIRQANELAALVLGEPLAAVGTAVVARRLERELESD